MKIFTRSEWSAVAPKSRITTTWDRRTEFVVHYSEGPTSQTPRSIQAFHMGPERGWPDIGYNFLVDVDGRICEGRGWLVVGAHAKGHNTSGIGVCFIGRDGDATDAAKAAIRDLYDLACEKAGRKLTLRGHGQLSGNSTSCPGKQLLAWVKAGAPRTGGNSKEKELVEKLPMLAQGAKPSEHVETLRALLRARSHQVDEKGAFDEKVDQAVRAVQKWGRVEVDGVVGPATWAVLLRVHD